MRSALQLPLRAAPRPIPTFRSRPAFFRPASSTLVSAANLQFGQPLHETHPHLVKPGELTPGIPALEYHHRRAALAEQLPPNSIAILAASDVKYRSGAVFYKFHQESNFFYLTGFSEPDAVAVIEKGSSDPEYTFHLLLRPKNSNDERWDGARSGLQAARDVFNADEAGNINDVQNVLQPIVNGAQEIYTDIGSPARQSAFARMFNNSPAKQDPFTRLLRKAKVKPLKPIMNSLRLTKSDAELECMRKAASISGSVITEAMRKTYTTEKQLGADINHGFLTQGLDGEAYIPVIAGGTNALSIHYTRNDAMLNPNDLVLVDAGGEYGGYITDITRTWPVNGKFTPPQRDLYAMLLEVQTQCLASCHAAASASLDSLHRIAETALRAGLKDLGFDTSRSEILDVLFPHHVGHYIGLDVHDAPGYPRTDRLKEDQCITIEPGVYVEEDDERWPKHFRGLGIRIEDSVRIGRTKPEIFTASAVKTVEEIEALRK